MTEGPTTGASRPTETGRRRRPVWLWILLALVLIALLIFFLVRCGSGSGPSGADPSTSAAATPTTSAPSSTTGAPGASGGGAQGGAAAGSLTADGTALLPVAQVAGANGELTALMGRTVTGNGVTVQSVPSDEGFWVGSSETDRVWVQLTIPAGESPYQVRPGQTVDLTGRVTAHDAGFAQQVDVDAAEGADQLTRQAAHIDVQKADLRITAG